MTVLATSSNAFSNVVKHEYDPASGFCRDVLTINDAAATLKVGAVLGKFIASPTGTAGANVGTGNGAMGAITVTSNANLQLGVYTLRIVKAAANAGDFTVTDPQGDVVGTGTVAVAFSGGGLAFTLADGATDFIVGDTIPITVAGTAKYKLVTAAATDGTQVASAVVIANNLGVSEDITITANTDKTVLALTRGPAIVGKAVLQLGADIDTDAEKLVVYNALKAVGILAETQV